MMSLSVLAARSTSVRSTMLLCALLAALGLAVVTAAPAAALDSVVLAVEGGDLGPEPMPRGAENNPARELGGYEDRDVPFTYGAAWLLTFLGLGGLATMGLVYWRYVDRPGRTKAPARR
jgi:hypothetical protein